MTPQHTHTEQTDSAKVACALITPELQRLEYGVHLLDELRVTFAQMADAGERDRAWAYLSDRFDEFEKSEMPGWENLDEDQVPDWSCS